MTSGPTGVRARRHTSTNTGQGPYRLEDQVGFILRKVSQRHAAIFADLIGDELTPTQFATLAKLHEIGKCSQNQLGRLVAMDAATIKGVVDRLIKRGLVHAQADPNDRRRLLVMLTDQGRTETATYLKRGFEITRQTLSPLDSGEIDALIKLLSKLS